MKHLGDVTKINGAEIEKVDCITFGAPCQDLSVAGNRKGMKHEEYGDEETTRSGLFYEAIRIIKEMREDDIKNGRTNEFIRPRYAVYENVPGALSSNKGEDFRCVLEEIAKVIEKDANIPGPSKGGWPYAGSILLEHGSIAWKLHDAQHWGVPQRRKRICVLADFNGFTAEDILFAPEYRRISERGQDNISIGCVTDGCRSEVQPVEPRMPRNIESSGEARQGSPGSIEDSFGIPSVEEPGNWVEQEGTIYFPKGF